MVGRVGFAIASLCESISVGAQPLLPVAINAAPRHLLYAPA